LAVIAAAVLAGIGVLFFKLFQIRGIEVSGATPYTAEQVIQGSGIKVGRNILFTGLKEAEEALTTKLPYIGAAEIVRKLPDKIRINTRETKAACVLNAGGLSLYIDPNGKVLGQAPSGKKAVVPGLKCPPPASAQTGRVLAFSDDSRYGVLAIYKDTLAAVKNSGLKDITLIDLSNPKDVTLVYKERVELHIGTPTKLENRLQLAAAVLNDRNTDTSRKGRIDLTIDKKAYYIEYN